MVNRLVEQLKMGSYVGQSTAERLLSWNLC
jgi:hypothetical protein